jgi:hypothetical protein
MSKRVFFESAGIEIAFVVDRKKVSLLCKNKLVLFESVTLHLLVQKRPINMQ